MTNHGPAGEHRSGRSGLEVPLWLAGDAGWWAHALEAPKATDRLEPLGVDHWRRLGQAARDQVVLAAGGIESFLVVGDFALLGGAFSQSASECENHRFEGFRLLDDEGPVQHGECAGDPLEAFSPQKHLQPVMTVRSIGRRRRRN